MLPSDLYARIRDRLDLANSGYLEDDEIGLACEEAYFDLWDFLIDRLGDEGPWQRVDLVTAANSDSVVVPIATHVYRMLRLEFASAGAKRYEPVRSLNLASDSIDAQPTSWADAGAFRYFARRSSRIDRGSAAIVGGGFATWTFYFSPPPSVIYTLRLYFVPPPPITLDSGGAYTGFPDEYPEYIVADVCAKMTDKQEADSAPFVAERERIKSRIERYAKPHQMNGPKRIADMRRLGSGGDDMDNWRRRR